MNHFISVWKNSFNYGGRARRKEYWMFALFNMIAVVFLSVLGSLIPGGSSQPVLWLTAWLPMIYMIASMIPTLAVSVRRMHDTSRSGWWLLINFVPLIGGIWFFVLTVLDSKPETNDWGASPKYNGVAVV
ncbi:DUF805 domain-containing protein [Hydrogenophaga sp. RWCD_12]|uniref:DUF805 domain-containing protein n=1 Tax=Hydrogenophaga sp. RWCD_12 TaxID=3391190 RepID=UPI00398487ED